MHHPHPLSPSANLGPYSLTTDLGRHVAWTPLIQDYRSPELEASSRARITKLADGWAADQIRLRRTESSNNQVRERKRANCKSSVSSPKWTRLDMLVES